MELELDLVDLKKEFELDKRFIKGLIKYEKEKLHKTFALANKKVLRIFDILLILGFIFNIGAVFLTNVMVVKEKTENNIPLEFREVNVIQAKLNNFVVHPDAKILLLTLGKQLLLWLVMISLYVYQRNTVYSRAVLIEMWITTLFSSTVLSWDFFNDFGFYIGRLIFGGG